MDHVMKRALRVAALEDSKDNNSLSHPYCKGEREKMQEQERHIRELLELTMKIARKTEHHISFEFAADGEFTNLYIFDMKNGTPQKYFAIYPYTGIERDEYDEAKKYFEEILEAEAS